MRIPIRMIGIATTVIWIFLIFFSISAIYSMKDIRVNLGQLRVSSTENHQVLLSFPVTIVNTGFYDLSDFNISTVIFGSNSSRVTEGYVYVPKVLHERTVNVTHDMKLNVTELLQSNKELAFNDTQLTANMTVSMKAANSIPIRASSNITVPWGAPLANLAINKPEFSTDNGIHPYVVVPVSFENHASFNLTGKIQLQVYSTAGNLVTQTETYIDVSQYSTYKGRLEFLIPLSAVSRAHFEVFFYTSYFTYGPLEVPYGT
jgi:hypothetical protein